MMEPDNLDRILGSEEELVPSSGFVSGVMDRVREEAAAPEPIAFPWNRVLPGAVAVAIGLVWCVVQLSRMILAEPATPVPLHFAGVMTPRVEGVAWGMVAMTASLLSWTLSRRLIGRRGLV